MIPKTLSATSIAVSELCLARWQAEMDLKTPQASNEAALLGGAVHGALEEFVKLVYITKEADPEWKLLSDLYQLAYIGHFGNLDKSSLWYKDGEEMLKKWMIRTDFTDVRVLTTELKKSFDVNTSVGKIPLNYIFDRMDEVNGQTIRVVDYKSVRAYITPDQLRSKVQARVYGLAAQIEYPDANLIHVVFDLLRHDPVGVYFTRQDNIETWQYIKAAAERIIATPDASPPETLNSECQYCPRKASCDTLKRNIAGGGIESLTDDQVVEMKYRIQSQLSGLSSLMEDLDQRIFQKAVEMDELEWDTPFGRVEISARSQRSVDASKAARVIGSELMAKYGKLNVGTVDALLKGTDLTPEEKAELKRCIGMTTGDPKPKIIPISKVEE